MFIFLYYNVLQSFIVVSPLEKTNCKYTFFISYMQVENDCQLMGFSNIKNEVEKPNRQHLQLSLQKSNFFSYICIITANSKTIIANY